MGMDIYISMDRWSMCLVVLTTTLSLMIYIYIAPGGPDATPRQLASMSARAHRRAPGHLAGADTAPQRRSRILPPIKAPGPWPPKPLGELANPRTRHICRPGLRLPSSSPALHPARRCGQLPRRANWRPTPPFSGPRSTAGRPSPRGQGGGPAGGAWLRGDRRAGGSYREGHPARAHTVRSPAIPASLTQRNAATLASPHSLSPGPLGPGRFYTDSPTPFGG